MTAAPFTKSDLGGWQELLQRPALSKSAFLGLIYGVFALSIPFADHKNLALLVCVFAVGAAYLLTNTVPSVLGLLLPALLLYSVTDDFLLPAVFLSVLVGGASGALLLACGHSRYHSGALLLIQTAVYLVPALYFGDPLRGLLTLLPAVLAVLFAVGVWRCLPQIHTLILGIAALSAALIVAGLVTLWATGVSTENPLLLVSDTLKSTVIAVMEEMRALYAEMGVAVNITDVMIANEAAMMVNLLPGIFVVLMAVTVYLAWRFLLRSLIHTAALPRLPLRLLGFSVSTVGAALFAVAFVAALIANADHATLFGVVAQNFALMLEPALALVGFGVLWQKEQRSCLSYILLFGLLFVIWNDPFSGLALASFYGAFHILAARFIPSPGGKGEK